MRLLRGRFEVLLEADSVDLAWGLPLRVEPTLGTGEAALEGIGDTFLETAVEKNLNCNVVALAALGCPV